MGARRTYRVRPGYVRVTDEDIAEIQRHLFTHGDGPMAAFARAAGIPYLWWNHCIHRLRVGGVLAIPKDRYKKIMRELNQGKGPYICHHSGLAKPEKYAIPVAMQKKLVGDREHGVSANDLAAKYGISKTTVYTTLRRWKQKQKETP